MSRGFAARTYVEEHQSSRLALISNLTRFLPALGGDGIISDSRIDPDPTILTSEQRPLESRFLKNAATSPFDRANPLSVISAFAPSFPSIERSLSHTLWGITALTLCRTLACRVFRCS